MKKLLVAVLTAAFSLSVFGYDIFSYVSINGNPKSYTSTEYSVALKFGDYFRTPASKVTHTFDAEGKEIETTEYTPRDVLVGKIVSTYDSKGNLTSKTETDEEGNNIRDVYAYKNGLLADISKYGKDNSLESKIIYTYNDRLLVDETGYDADGTLIWKNIYKYEGDNLVSEYVYFADGSLKEEKTYKYTDSGLIDSITTNNVIDGQKQEVFRRASNGQLNEITIYNASNKVIERLVIKYDSKGNMNKLSDYSVAEKFGTTVNELVYMAEYVYSY